MIPRPFVLYGIVVLLLSPPSMAQEKPALETQPTPTATDAPAPEAGESTGGEEEPAEPEESNEDLGKAKREEKSESEDEEFEPEKVSEKAIKKKKKSKKSKEGVEPTYDHIDVSELEWSARLLAPKKSKRKIKALTFPRKSLKVRFKHSKKNNRIIPYVSIIGRYTDKDRYLVFGSKKIRLSKKKKLFRLRLPIKDDKKSSRFTFFEVQASGKLVQESIRVKVDDFEDFKNKKYLEETKDTDTMSFGLSYSLITYSQSGRTDESISGLTLQGAYNHVFGENWELGGNFFFTLFNLGVSPSSTDVRYLGINVRGGYRFKLGKTWSFSLLGGIFYTRMFVGNEALGFGYGDLLYPQIYPVLRKAWTDRLFSYLYLKYVPMSSAFAIGLDERELAFGIGTVYAFPWGRLIWGFDYSSIQYNAEPLIIVGSNVLNFSMSYGFDL